MKPFVPALIALSLIAGHTHAQEAYRLCKLVQNEADRLRCFDAATALPAPTEKPEQAAPEKQLWSVTEDRAPLDDAPQVSAILLSLDTKTGLAVRCKEHKTELAVLTQGAFLGLSDALKVTYRIGDAAPISAMWNAASGGQGAFSPAAVPFIRALPDDGKLFFRIFDFKGTPHDASFNLDKVSDVRSKVAIACSWDQKPPAAPPVRFIPPPTR